MIQRWSDLKGHHVLVVDDNEDTRNCSGPCSKHTARPLGRRPRWLTRAPRWPYRLPDVLITDLAMPVEDGFGLLEYCRHHADPRLQRCRSWR